MYENVGEYNKAYITYRTYANLVDTLYIRKEQEIEQAKRFAKRIAENRNRIASLEKDKELTESKVSLAVKDQQLSLERNKGSAIRYLFIITWNYSNGGFYIFIVSKQSKTKSWLIIYWH